MLTKFILRFYRYSLEHCFNSEVYFIKVSIKSFKMQGKFCKKLSLTYSCISICILFIILLVFFHFGLNIFLIDQLMSNCN